MLCERVRRVARCLAVLGGRLPLAGVQCVALRVVLGGRRRRAGLLARLCGGLAVGREGAPDTCLRLAEHETPQSLWQGVRGSGLAACLRRLAGAA